MNNEERKEIIEKTWNMALTFATNICSEISNEFNDDDFIEEANAAHKCANRLRASIDHVHPHVHKELLK